MGKVADALERRQREMPIKLEDLKEQIPKRLDVKEPELALARESVSQQHVSDKLVVLSAPDSPDAENFKILRGQILFPRDGKVARTILVTSTFPGEGKTLVSANIAVSLALSIDEYVIAIDADLRRPRLHHIFGYRQSRGLHEYLVGGIAMDELVVKSGINKLSILPAGKRPRNPTEILSSNMMAKFLEEIKEQYKDWFVIIDSPPTSITADTRFLAQEVDGIIFVIMANKTPRRDVQKALDNLGREKVLGIVFNGYQKAHKSYYRYYDRYYKNR